MTDRRRLTRPRTKVYDSNYSLGEQYYKSAIDGLDRKYGKLPTETMEAPKRPQSIGDFESFINPPNHQNAQRVRDDHQQYMDDEMSATLKRIQRARLAIAPSTEEEFENTFFNRREEVKKNYSEKMLNTVGLNGLHISEESVRRRKQHEFDDNIPQVTAKWTAMKDAAVDSLDEGAAKARARASKNRLADLEAEMDDIVEKGVARERRLAGLKQLLNSESESNNTSAVRMRKKITITEKRIV